MAPITEEELKNPHIRFFADSNPGWHKVQHHLVYNKHRKACSMKIDVVMTIEVVIKNGYTAYKQFLPYS